MLSRWRRYSSSVSNDARLFADRRRRRLLCRRHLRRLHHRQWRRLENARGGSGDDLLIGNSVANRLDGNGGDDVLIGGAGADTLNGGAGFDTAGYQTADAGVTASLASMRGTAGDAASYRYSSVEALIGSKFGDRLSGGNANDTIDGNDGNDIISGGNGNDTLLGGDGDGDDDVDGGNGIDGLDGGDGNDDLTGGNGNDVIAGGDGDDDLDGGNGNDDLDGGAGDDRVEGGNGNDLVNGGAGDDTLLGGNGNDRFLFGETGGEDRILDFRRGDRIDLGELDIFEFVGSDAFSCNAGEVRSYRSGGQNFLEGDVDGDGAADFTILTNILINAGDLILGSEVIAS